MKFISN